MVTTKGQLRLNKRGFWMFEVDEKQRDKINYKMKFWKKR